MLGDRSLARHALGLALGAVPADGPSCAVCGPTPFGPSRSVDDVCGPNFTDYDLLQGRRGDRVDGEQRRAYETILRRLA